MSKKLENKKLKNTRIFSKVFRNVKKSQLLRRFSKLSIYVIHGIELFRLVGSFRQVADFNYKKMKQYRSVHFTLYLKGRRDVGAQFVLLESN